MVDIILFLGWVILMIFLALVGALFVIGAINAILVESKIPFNIPANVETVSAFAVLIMLFK